MIAQRVLTERETAEYLGVSTSYLRQSRSRGSKTLRAEAPPWVKCGAMVRYRLEDLDAWLAHHLVTPDAPTGEIRAGGR